MKKIICGLLCVLLLFGCSKSKGTFKEGTKDMDALYDDISEHIMDGEWDMALLDDTMWSKKQIEKEYQLDLTSVEESYVKSSAIEAEFSEIAFFKVSKKKETDVKKAIDHRLNTLEKTWGSYMIDTKEQLKNVRTGRIGQYYYMILGEDCKKVVNYIYDMK